MKEGGKCKITKLISKTDFAVEKSEVWEKCTKDHYKKFDVGDEHVLYFKNSDVTIALDDKMGNVGTFSGKWVIANDGGNIFIDKDIYNAYTTDKFMVLLSFSDLNTSNIDEYYSTGNVYIAPCKVDGKAGVKNIQAIIIADGTIFSYDKNKSTLNAKGEPQWNSYADRVNALNCQLLIEGSVYSDNTIGGADLDKVENPKEYLLLGDGTVLKLPVSWEDRIRAQLYDFNYLRTFRLDLEIGENGCPIDQKCGKALCAEDIKKIANGETVCGDYESCDPNGDADQKDACDGINPFEKFSAAMPEGDLFLPGNSEKSAKELDPDTDIDPVYIYQRLAPSKSFVFMK